MKYYVLITEEYGDNGEIIPYDGDDAIEVFKSEKEALETQKKLWKSLSHEEKNNMFRFDVGEIEFNEEILKRAIERDGSMFDEDEEDEIENVKALIMCYDVDKCIKEMSILKDEVFAEEYDENDQLRKYIEGYDYVRNRPEGLKEILGITEEKAKKIRKEIKEFIKENGDKYYYYYSELENIIEEIISE